MFEGGTMTPTVALPALDGRQPLGFLAALGVLRLLDGDEIAVSLVVGRGSAHAVLHGVDSLDQVIEVLADIASRDTRRALIFPTAWLRG